MRSASPSRPSATRFAGGRWDGPPPRPWAWARMTAKLAANYESLYQVKDGG